MRSILPLQQQPPRDADRSRYRASTAALGGIMLLGLVVVLAASLGIVLVDVGETAGPTAPVALDLVVTGDTFRFTHEHGEPLDVRTLTMTVEVDGEPLAEQPPIPFFSAAGFSPGPTGPFNTAADPEWNVGETASFTVAGTNAPEINPGSTISVRLHRDGMTVLTVETTASAA